MDIGYVDNERLANIRTVNEPPRTIGDINSPLGASVYHDNCISQPNRAIEVCVQFFCDDPGGSCDFDVSDYNLSDQSFDLHKFFGYGTLGYTVDGTNYIGQPVNISQTNEAEYSHDILVKSLIVDHGLGSNCNPNGYLVSQSRSCFFIPFYLTVQNRNLAPLPSSGSHGVTVYDEDDDIDLATEGFNYSIYPIQTDILQTSISASKSTGVLNNSGLSFEDTLVVQGTFKINESYTFNQCNIKFEPDAKIVVENGQTLTFLSCYLASCKTDVWEGIEVKPGGILEFHDSGIWDARTAISAEPSSTVKFGTNGTIRNFENIGLKAEQATLQGIGFPEVRLLQFLTNGNSKFATSNSPIGIEITNIASGPTFDLCEFSNLETCIDIANNTNIGVTQSPIFDSENGVVLKNNSSVSVAQSDLFNLTNGIDGNDNCDINVESSTFVNMTQAIEATQESYARIVSSEFDNVSGIPSTAINAKRGAVHVGNTSRLSFKGLGGTTASDPTFVGCPFPFTGWGLSSMQVSETRIPSSTVALGNYVGSNVFVTDCHFTSDETTIDLALAISNFNVFDNNTLISNGQPADAVIKSQNLSQPLSFISSNTIQASNDCGDGLLMVNADPLYLTENVFDLSTDAFDEATGADLQFVTSNIRCNNFTGKGNGNNLQDGIEASTVTGTISCNVFENNDYGYQTLITGGIDMVANEFKDQYIGLYLERGTEISTQNHRGNTWTGSFDVDGAQNLNTDPLMALNSQFKVEDGKPVDGLPTFYTPSGANWFVDEILQGSLPTCPSDCAPELADPDEILGDIEDKIGFWLDYVQPAQGHPYYDAELFNQRSDLYSRLKKVDSIPAALSSFYTSYIQTDEAQLVDLIDDMPALIQPNGIGDLNNAILADSLLLRNYLDSAIQTPIVLDTQAISQWQQDLNAVTTTSNAAYNVKDMLEMQAIKVLDPLYEYSSQEWNNITTLASSCPSTEGYGVYLARAITMSLSNIKYDDVSLCATANQSRSIQHQVDEKIEQLLVAPNPGFNHIRITVPDELKGETLRVFDIHGTLMREIDINSTNLSLDISNYQAGNYILQSGRFVERFVKISE